MLSDFRTPHTWHIASVLSSFQATAPRQPFGHTQNTILAPDSEMRCKKSDNKRVKSGETAIEWREETTATAGKKGTIDIPDTIELGMQVYEGGDAYRLTARFRYRIGTGQLVLGYVLERAGDVKRDAFGQVVQQVAAGAERDVWHGTP